MKISKKVPFVLITAALLMFALAAGCSSVAEPVQREEGRVYELVLLHTNDHHGRILPQGGQGGVAERMTFIEQVRANHQNVLLVDAGDMNTGTALANMFGGELDIAAYNLMGYDAMTFGNHEFNVNLARINRQVGLSDFSWVSSNVQQGRRYLGGNQYLVMDYEGFRVGIIGITTLRTLDISSAHAMNIRFLDEITAAQEAVTLLRERELVDIVIALTHLGDNRESDEHTTVQDVAAAVPGIDIFVDGHAHSFFSQPLRVGNAYVVSANDWGRYVGEARIAIVDGRIQSFDWRPVAINTATAQTFAPHPEMTALLAPYLEQAEASLSEVIGNATDTFIFGDRQTRFIETALGNMINDANTWYFREVMNQQLDFAFHNGGNMRAELPAGPLTRENILTVLPFENFLWIVDLSGAEVIELFNFMATIPQGAGGFPQVSSDVRFAIDVPSQTISGLTIGGAPVDPNRTYRFVTNDFLLGGGDGYTILTRATNQYNAQLLLSYVVIEYIASRGGTITPATDGRMVVTGGVEVR
ncbi:MAG: 5'-nucleotidase C-terminal domain-containing protein [Treponema sp.]|nr:5'-nucleotidase C-terminal domain-containing protein [Treponema sp.]